MTPRNFVHGFGKRPTAGEVHSGHRVIDRDRHGNGVGYQELDLVVEGRTDDGMASFNSGGSNTANVKDQLPR